MCWWLMTAHCWLPTHVVGSRRSSVVALPVLDSRNLIVERNSRGGSEYRTCHSFSKPCTRSHSFSFQWLALFGCARVDESLASRSHTYCALCSEHAFMVRHRWMFACTLSITSGGLKQSHKREHN